MSKKEALRVVAYALLVCAVVIFTAAIVYAWLEFGGIICASVALAIVCGIISGFLLVLTHERAEDERTKNN